MYMLCNQRIYVLYCANVLRLGQGTWSIKKRLDRNEMNMIIEMCVLTLKERKENTELRDLLGWSIQPGD